MTDAAPWTQPLISIDVVPMRCRNGVAEVLLGTRANAPFAGRPALPGVLMQRERSVDAAARALESKVGLDPSVAVFRDVGVFDAVDRDPRGPTMSIVKLAVIPAAASAPAPDAPNTTALPLDEATGLPFDHDAIIVAAISRLHQLLWTDRDVTRAFFGDLFSTRDAHRVHARIAEFVGIERPMAISNLKRKMQDLGWVRPSDRISESGAKGGRPSFLWTWVEPDTEM